MVDVPATDEKYSARDQFGFRLGRLARLWRARLDDKMRPHGLTQARWVVLMHLQRGANGYQQKALARFVGVEGPTLVHILDNLEGQNLIERRQDETDRRGKTVYLTDKGWDMLDVLDHDAADVRREHLDGISDEDLAHCLNIFDRIQKRADAAVDAAVGADVDAAVDAAVEEGSQNGADMNMSATKSEGK